jgi:thioredoxin-like negative regulator of GroEL
MKLLPFFIVAIQALPHSLTTENFDSLVHDSTKNVMIYFFEPGCTNCAEIESAWESFGIEMKDSDNMVVGSMDCKSHEELCSNLSVKSTPKILLFKHGNQPILYHDAMDLEHIRMFAKRSYLKCTVVDTTTCTEKELTLIKELTKYPQRASVGINKWLAVIKENEKEREEALNSMRKTYDTLKKKLEDSTDELRRKIEIARSAIKSGKSSHDEL